ncbi:hypothetical protein TGRH88_045370 [Toxoplasma gondii]|uniref:Uncharacterized protein n=1 Tax=Toxoplasma gondii TaxID=5811 RepID=A0A7J6K2F6_TOXGO|nr:hypothetical protein TGRH88_045370 [Toxoplasma gondii]
MWKPAAVTIKNSDSERRIDTPWLLPPFTACCCGPSRDLALGHNEKQRDKVAPGSSSFMRLEDLFDDCDAKDRELQERCQRSTWVVKVPLRICNHLPFPVTLHLKDAAAPTNTQRVECHSDATSKCTDAGSKKESSALPLKPSGTNCRDPRHARQPSSSACMAPSAAFGNQSHPDEFRPLDEMADRKHGMVTRVQAAAAAAGRGSCEVIVPSLQQRLCCGVHGAEVLLASMKLPQSSWSEFYRVWGVTSPVGQKNFEVAHDPKDNIWCTDDGHAKRASAMASSEVGDGATPSYGSSGGAHRGNQRAGGRIGMAYSKSPIHEVQVIRVADLHKRKIFEVRVTVIYSPFDPMLPPHFPGVAAALTMIISAPVWLSQRCIQAPLSFVPLAPPREAATSWERASDLARGLCTAPQFSETESIADECCLASASGYAECEVDTPLAMYNAGRFLTQGSQPRHRQSRMLRRRDTKQEGTISTEQADGGSSCLDPHCSAFLPSTISPPHAALPLRVGCYDMVLQQSGTCTPDTHLLCLTMFPALFHNLVSSSLPRSTLRGAPRASFVSGSRLTRAGTSLSLYGASDTWSENEHADNSNGDAKEDEILPCLSTATPLPAEEDRSAASFPRAATSFPCYVSSATSLSTALLSASSLLTARSVLLQCVPRFVFINSLNVDLEIRQANVSVPFAMLSYFPPGSHSYGFHDRGSKDSPSAFALNRRRDSAMWLDTGVGGSFGIPGDDDEVEQEMSLFNTVFMTPSSPILFLPKGAAAVFHFPDPTMPYAVNIRLASHTYSSPQTTRFRRPQTHNLHVHQPDIYRMLNAGDHSIPSDSPLLLPHPSFEGMRLLDVLREENILFMQDRYCRDGAAAALAAASDGEHLSNSRGSANGSVASWKDQEMPLRNTQADDGYHSREPAEDSASLALEWSSRVAGRQVPQQQTGIPLQGYNSKGVGSGGSLLNASSGHTSTIDVDATNAQRGQAFQTRDPVTSTLFGRNVSYGRDGRFSPSIRSPPPLAHSSPLDRDFLGAVASPAGAATRVEPNCLYVSCPAPETSAYRRIDPVVAADIGNEKISPRRLDGSSSYSSYASNSAVSGILNPLLTTCRGPDIASGKAASAEVGGKDAVSHAVSADPECSAEAALAAATRSSSQSFPVLDCLGNLFAAVEATIGNSDDGKGGICCVTFSAARTAPLHVENHLESSYILVATSSPACFTTAACATFAPGASEWRATKRNRVTTTAGESSDSGNAGFRKLHPHIDSDWSDGNCGPPPVCIAPRQSKPFWLQRALPLCPACEAADIAATSASRSAAAAAAAAASAAIEADRLVQVRAARSATVKRLDTERIKLKKGGRRCVARHNSKRPAGFRFPGDMDEKQKGRRVASRDNVWSSRRTSVARPSGSLRRPASTSDNGCRRAIPRGAHLHDGSTDDDPEEWYHSSVAMTDSGISCSTPVVSEDWHGDMRELSVDSVSSLSSESCRRNTVNVHRGCTSSSFESDTLSDRFLQKRGRFGGDDISLENGSVSDFLWPPPALRQIQKQLETAFGEGIKKCQQTAAATAGILKQSLQWPELTDTEDHIRRLQALPATRSWGRQGVLRWFEKLEAAERQPGQPIEHVANCPRRRFSTNMAATSGQPDLAGSVRTPLDRTAGGRSWGTSPFRGADESGGTACEAAAGTAEKYDGSLNMNCLREKLYIQIVGEDVAWVEVDVYKKKTTKLVLQNPRRTFYFYSRTEGRTSILSVSHVPPPESLSVLNTPERGGARTSQEKASLDPSEGLSRSETSSEESLVTAHGKGAAQKDNSPNQRTTGANRDDPAQWSGMEGMAEPVIPEIDGAGKRMHQKEMKVTLQLPCLSFSFIFGSPPSAVDRAMGVYRNPREASSQALSCPSQFQLDVRSLKFSITSRYLVPYNFARINGSGGSGGHALLARHLCSFSIQQFHLFDFSPEATNFPVVLAPASRAYYSEGTAAATFPGAAECESIGRQKSASFSGADRTGILPVSRRCVRRNNRDGVVDDAGPARIQDKASAAAELHTDPATLRIDVLASSKRQQGYPGMYPFMVYVQQSICDLRVSCAPLVINIDIGRILSALRDFLEIARGTASPLLLQLQSRPFRLPAGLQDNLNISTRAGIVGTLLPEVAGNIDRVSSEWFFPPGVMFQEGRRRSPTSSLSAHRCLVTSSWSGTADGESTACCALPPAALGRQNRTQDGFCLSSLERSSSPSAGPAHTASPSAVASFPSFFFTCFPSASVPAFGPSFTPPAPPATEITELAVDSLYIDPVILSISFFFDDLLKGARESRSAQVMVEQRRTGICHTDLSPQKNPGEKTNESTPGQMALMGGTFWLREAEDPAKTERRMLHQKLPHEHSVADPLLSVFLRSLNVDNAIVNIRDFSFEYAGLPLSLVLFFLTQHFRKQLMTAATTTALSTGGLLNVGAWQDRMKAFDAFIATVFSPSADSLEASSVINATSLPAQRGYCTGRPADARHETILSIRRRRGENSHFEPPMRVDPNALASAIRADPDLIRSNVLMRAEALGAAASVILEGLADAVSRVFGLYGAAVLSAFMDMSHSNMESRGGHGSIASSATRTLQLMMPAPQTAGLADEVREVQRLPPALLFEGLIRGWTRLVQDCGDALQDFVRYPLVSASTHGVRRLPGAVLSGCLSLMLKPLIGVCEFIALSASGLQNELRQRRPQLSSSQQLLLQQLLLLMRGSPVGGGAAPAPFLGSATIAPHFILSTNSAQLPMLSRSPTAPLSASSAASAALAFASSSSYTNLLPLPRMLYGPERVLQPYDSRDSFIQLMLMQLPALRGLAYTTHARDRRPPAAAAEVAHAMGIAFRRHPEIGPALWKAPPSEAYPEMPSGLLVEARHGSHERGGRRRSGYCSAGVFILVIAGDTCFVVIGWPLVVLLRFKVKHISSVHCVQVPARSVRPPPGENASSRGKQRSRRDWRRDSGGGDPLATTPARREPDQADEKANTATTTPDKNSKDPGLEYQLMPETSFRRKRGPQSSHRCRVVICVAMDDELSDQVSRCNAAVSAASASIASSHVGAAGALSATSRGIGGPFFGAGFAAIGRVWQKSVGFSQVSLDDTDGSEQFEHPAAMHRLFWVVDVSPPTQRENVGDLASSSSPRPAGNESRPVRNSQFRSGLAEDAAADSTSLPVDESDQENDHATGSPLVPGRASPSGDGERRRSIAASTVSNKVGPQTSGRTATSPRVGQDGGGTRDGRSLRWMVLQLNSVDEDKAQEFKREIVRVNALSC